jgi:serine protease Do
MPAFRYFALILTLGLSFAAATDAQQSARRRTPVVEAVARVAPAVVNISTQRVMRRQRHPLDSFFDFGETRAERAPGRLRNHSLGSGVVVDPKGYVVTNDHVIRQADQILVSFAEGEPLKATVVGRDAANDLAVLRIEKAGPYPTARLARSGDLLLGETTIALGNPFGLGGSVTDGILSAWNRTVEFRGRKAFEDFLQTSAVINPGNSGGPLANMDGEVIGINVAIHSRGPGIGFAIPIQRVREVMYRLLDPPVARKIWIGLDLNHDRESPGAGIAAVDRAGPAAQAGLQRGDRVVEIASQPVRDWIDFQTTVDSTRAGDVLELLVERDGRRERRQVRVLAAPPSDDVKATFAQLGFEYRDPRGPGETRREGIFVSRVIPGSSAAEIGIEAGDLIYQLGNYGVRSADRVPDILAYYLRRGTSGIKLSLYRPATDEHLAGRLALKPAQKTR